MLQPYLLIFFSMDTKKRSRVIYTIPGQALLNHVRQSNKALILDL